MALETRNQPVLDDTRRQIAQIRAAMEAVERERLAYALAVLRLKVITRAVHD